MAEVQVRNSQTGPADRTGKECRMFAFRTAINVSCGFGAVDGIGDAVKGMGYNRVLFVTDPGLVKAGLAERVTKKLEAAGIGFSIFDTVEPNPRDSSIEAAWEAVKHEPIEAVVGLGGGSSMDAAKAAATLATNGGKLAQYDGAGTIKKPVLPIIAIPTTAGTGSEVTSNAAITDAARHYKMSLRSPYLIPSLAILDPGLLAGLPARIAAESSMDAIIHAAEGFTSNKANALSDSLAVQALEFLCPNIRAFIGRRSNKEAAENMLLGSMFAGTVIGNTGTGADHALARALGGARDTPHGLACALMYPYVVRYNFIADPAKYRKLAQLLGLSVCCLSDSALCDALVAELFRLSDDLGIPTKLSAIGVERSDLPGIAEVAAGNSGPNPRSTSAKELLALLEEAF